MGAGAERAHKRRQPVPMPPSNKYRASHRLPPGAIPAGPLSGPARGDWAVLFSPRILRNQPKKNPTMKSSIVSDLTPPEPETAATKKRRQRRELLAEFAAAPHSAVVTDAEWAYLRRAFKGKFGHDWTVGARRTHRDMSRATCFSKAPVEASAGQQQTLF